MLGTEKLYTAEQTRALDHCAIHDHGIPGITLMSRAARSAFDCLLEVWPDPDHIQILCGTGNNGGDGFLIADLAARKNRLGARALREVFGTIVKRLEFDPLTTGLVREQEGQQVLEITKEVVDASQPPE